jgi:N,N'-diacetyllegionaminate synthase
MRIGAFDTASRVFVVAEIGNNHEGDPEVAVQLVRSAAECRADAVKLQTYRTALFVRPADTERYERLARFELASSVVEQLAELAHSLGLLFVSTPLDLESAAFLEPLVDAYKIASGDNNFGPLLDALGRTGKPLIISSGLADIDEVAAAVERVRTAGAGELAVLHCTSSYPAPPGEANLSVIRSLGERLRCTIGYSDHTHGVEVGVTAVAAGARIVEKHFTLDKAHSDFRDHALSADPAEFRELVKRIRHVEELLGSPEKRLQPSEVETARAARRSIVAAADLPAGHRLSPPDLTWLRPGDGLPPGNEEELVGRTLRRRVSFGDPIMPADVN